MTRTKLDDIRDVVREELAKALHDAFPANGKFAAMAGIYPADPFGRPDEPRTLMGDRIVAMSNDYHAVVVEKGGSQPYKARVFSRKDGEQVDLAECVSYEEAVSQCWRLVGERQDWIDKGRGVVAMPKAKMKAAPPRVDTTEGKHDGIETPPRFKWGADKADAWEMQTDIHHALVVRLADDAYAVHVEAARDGYNDYCSISTSEIEAKQAAEAHIDHEEDH